MSKFDVEMSASLTALNLAIGNFLIAALISSVSIFTLSDEV